MFDIGIKDIIDILIVATILFYVYKIMKESGTLSIFLGVLSFIVVWFVASVFLQMELTGRILDKFMNIGLLILVIIFQDQIKRFLVEIGSHKRWHFLHAMFKRKKSDNREETKEWVLPLVYSCINMSKSKTGALIVIRNNVPLDNYENSGDIINANINSRLIENIFFKNSPLHDGAMIIDRERICAAGCILPVSHDEDVPRQLGLRHRSALGISQFSDALAIVVSEETGAISIAYKGKLSLRLNPTELEAKVTEFARQLE
ncbi:MAG: diadenylate cyclase CdaA [Bacteroidales bacterium]|nr:diadenylate cyclase CdaA [Bacteroidales bacterium]MDD6141735.1 diadenylate cyclase CdaA [Bacteroidales bacterium]MDD6622227.1 diadenylate cyclase CdaA [Bacteroidales bacterium]MDD6668553.1 diadenylate cyclase CdaA [Bacteroidales bacterium]